MNKVPRHSLHNNILNKKKIINWVPVCTIHGRNTENEWEQEIRKLLLIDVFCSVFCVLSSTTLIKIEDGHNWSKWINNFKSQKKRKKKANQYPSFVPTGTFTSQSDSYPIPLPITWWALQMRSRSCRFRNLLTTSAPKVKETPRSFSPQPCTSLSGSDHNRSHSRPGIHTGRR